MFLTSSQTPRELRDRAGGGFEVACGPRPPRARRRPAPVLSAPMVRLIPFRPWAWAESRRSRLPAGADRCRRGSAGPIPGTTRPARERNPRRRRRSRATRRSTSDRARGMGGLRASRASRARLQELGLADRLGQVAVEAGRRQRSRSPCMAWAVSAMTGVDRRLTLRAGGWPGQPRNRPSRASAGPSGRRRSVSFSSAASAAAPSGSDDHRVAQMLEHAHGHFLVDGMVLGQQDAQPGGRGVGRCWTLPGLSGGRRTSSRSVPQGHFLGQGVEELGLAHRLGQAGRDRQSCGSARSHPAARRRSAGAAGPRRSRARGGSARPGRARPSRASCRRPARSGYGSAAPRGTAQAPPGRGQAAVDRRSAALPSSSGLRQDQPVGGIVVDDQGPAGLRAARGPARAARCVDRSCTASLTVNQKVLPLPGSLSTQMRAAHQLDQLGRDRQAQPGAAEAAGGRAVGLLERLEDRLQLLGRNADAGVGDGDQQGDCSSLGVPATETVTTTSPRSVNLIALPTRLTRTWRSRPASPIKRRARRGRCGRPARGPWLCPQGQRLEGLVERIAQGEGSVGRG